MEAAVRRVVATARREGREPAHLALTEDDERAIGVGCVLYCGLPVKRAWRAKVSHLWAKAGTTLKAYPVPPGVERDTTR